MDKYISHVTVEQFKTALDLLENTWTQIEYINGTPGQEITVYTSDIILVNNLINDNEAWEAENASFGFINEQSMIYPTYNKIWIRSYYNNTSQFISKCRYPLSLISNHKYYISVFMDGINSNENLNLNSYNDTCNRYGIALEDKTANIDLINYFVQDLDVHRFNGIFEVPANSGNHDYFLSLFANNDILAKDATVYFGQIACVDLTDRFGLGSEPSVDWCNSYLNFFTATKSSQVIKVIKTDNGISLTGTFDSNGKCIISVPGYDSYTAAITDENNNITYYSTTEVNKVKRYQVDILQNFRMLKDINLNIMITNDGKIVKPVTSGYVSRFTGDQINAFISEALSWGEV